LVRGTKVQYKPSWPLGANSKRCPRGNGPNPSRDREPGKPEPQQLRRHAVGVVAQQVAFMHEVAGDGLDAEGADAVEVGLDGELALAGVAFQQCG